MRDRNGTNQKTPVGLLAFGELKSDIETRFLGSAGCKVAPQRASKPSYLQCLASTLSGCKVACLSSLRICLYLRLCLLLHHIAPRSRRTQISWSVSEATFPALNFHDIYHPIAECRIISSHFPVGLQVCWVLRGTGVLRTVFVSTFWM